MCGFAGFTINNSGKKAKEIAELKDKTIERMMGAIVHRGPDSQKAYVDEDIALGFVRLSIIDLEGGTQPMTCEDESKWIVFNGEIYNYQKLREDLQEKGHIFKTSCDTEVLIHGYEEYGKELLPKLRGMFAFAIWDKKSKSLFGARDFFGIKPFYYGEIDGDLLFGSEIKAFLAHPEFKKELNGEKLPDYMTFGCVPGYDTFFKNVYKLPPGHSIEFKDGKINIEKYFEVSFAPDENKSFEEFAKECGDAFTESTEAHKISDVEVGCFLSSGVDSSIAAYELSRVQEVRSYTIGFAEEKYSEAADAKVLADELEIENYQKIVSSEEYFENAAKVQYHLDEPLANPSANLLYFLSQRAAEDLKVVLSGEGADEMFGGYNVYKEPLAVSKYQRRVPRFLRKSLAAVAKALPEVKGKGFLIRGSKTIEERYIGNSNVFAYGDRQKYLAKNYDEKAPQIYSQPFYDKVKGLDDVTKMQYLDMHLWMVQEILLKADKMSMAHSLELRVPFLDMEIYKFIRTIPGKFKVNEENTKLVLRKAAQEKINRTSANRTKMAFPLPLPDWIREDRYYSAIKAAFESNASAEFFNKKEIIRLLDEHKTGKYNHARKIWAVYTFILWHEVYFGEKKRHSA